MQMLYVFDRLFPKIVHRYHKFWKWVFYFQKRIKFPLDSVFVIKFLRCNWQYG